MLQERIIPASEFVEFDKIYQDILTTHGGALAVNDVFLPFWTKPYDIILSYGGRGGGKSEAAADRLIEDCMTQAYFKCYYGRKIFDNVRDSCFATLVACIEKSNLQHLFSYSKAEHSTMRITYRSNGNTFIPFGSDKADKLKSIKDPSHLWCEELDQFTLEDFKDLYPVLRTPKGANVFIGTFNTPAVLPTHWLLKVFFPKQYEGTDKDKDDTKFANLLKNKRVCKVFVNYTDNYFIDKEAYTDTLMLAAAGNMAIFEGIANGAWGIEINDSPWLFAFDRRKHVAKHELHADINEILYLSFDFNRNPQVCTIMQWPNESELHIIDVIKEKNIGTEGICEIILAKYPGFVYVVTGDYSGDTVSSIHKEHVTNYTMIQRMLNIGEGQLKIKPNPKLSKNQTLVNSVFYRYTVKVCPVKARYFIYDAEKVKKRADGEIVKDNRDDPTQQADVLDTVRYWINYFMDWFINWIDK